MINPHALQNEFLWSLMSLTMSKPQFPRQGNVPHLPLRVTVMHLLRARPGGAPRVTDTTAWFVTTGLRWFEPGQVEAAPAWMVRAHPACPLPL